VLLAFNQSPHLLQPPSHCPAQLLCVSLTCVRNGARRFAVCLDGSPPAYHLHRGSGAGARGWLLQFEGGGWCNTARSCAERAGTRRGSTSLMTKLEVFSGVLSNDPAMNPGASLNSTAALPASFLFRTRFRIPQQDVSPTHSSSHYSHRALHASS
jgi:hypothetical protein